MAGRGTIGRVFVLLILILLLAILILAFYACYLADRIAQACILPIPRVSFEFVDELGETARGKGGFGSTGA